MDIIETEPKEAFNEIEKHHDDPDFIVLDVRTPEEYQMGHLENAKLLNVKSSDFEDELEKMDKEKTYYVYCKAGVRSLTAARLMKKHNFQNVVSIIGGIDKWMAKRLPITAD